MSSRPLKPGGVLADNSNNSYNSVKHIVKKMCKQTEKVPVSLGPPPNKSVSETDMYTNSSFENRLTSSRN